MLSNLTDSLPYFLIGLFILVALIFFAVVYFSGISLKEQFQNLSLKDSKFVQGFHKGKSAFQQTVERFFEKILNILYIRPSGPFYDSIRLVKKALKSHLTGKNYTYALPWFAVVGDSYAGKSSMLENIKLPNPLASPNFGIPAHDPLVQWWFFEKGIVVEPKGSVLDDKTFSPDQSWEAFLKSLRRYRPSRPLDGLILTVPASYFTGPEALSMADIKKRGRAISDQLVKTESILGLGLPLYIVITKCDLLGGFTGFCREIPSGSEQEMLGWSNSYTTDLSYISKWIKEAFIYLKGAFLQTVLRTFTKRQAQGYEDDVMIFPNSFLKIEAGLQVYLDEVLQEDDYKDHFILRGIYATGRLENSESSSGYSHLFLRDLFSKKIFEERGIAYPLKKFLISTSRAFNIVRLGILATFVFGSLGVYFMYNRINNMTLKLTPVMLEALYSLKRTNASSLKTLSETLQPEYVLNVITQVGNITTHVPSWITFLDNDLERISQTLFDRLIAYPMADNLNQKARKLMVEPINLASPIVDERTALNPTETPEFLLLEGYINELETLEHMSIAYSSLPITQSLEAFEKLSAYLYDGYKVIYTPSNKVLFKQFIGEATYETFNLTYYELSAEKRLYELYNNFLKRILDPAYTSALIYKLQKTLQQVEGRGVPDLGSFRESLSEIKDLLVFITNSGASWLTNPIFDPGARYKKLMDKIKFISFFGDNVQKRIVEISERLYQKSSTYLQSYGSPLTGYFLTMSPVTKRLEPSQGLRTLEKGLKSFLNQPFMQKADGRQFVDVVPDHQFLYWDANNIRNALTLIENYRSFMERELQTYPINLQDTLKVVAREQIQANIDVMLERAQSFYEKPMQIWGKQAENAFQVQANNINETGSLFIKLLKGLEGIGAQVTYGKLKNLLFSQMYASLDMLDKRLQQSDFYSPPDPEFKNWHGGKDGVLKAYNLLDQDEMVSYFANQSARVMNLSLQLAAPIISFLKSDAFNLTIDQIKIITHWNGLLEDATAYEKGKAVGSMKTLEKFLTESGNQITYETCFSSLDPNIINARTGDYFLQRRNMIMQGMYKRCQELAAEKGVQQYKKAAEYFNSYIANRFPFVGIISKESLSDSDVSYAILEEFFKEFDILTPEIVASMDAVLKKTDAWEKVKTFIQNMRRVKDFVQNYLAPLNKDGLAGLTFMLRFNENKMKSMLSDQVTDWAFINGDKSFSLRENGNGNTVRYTAGNTISFGFEWNPMFMTFPVKTSVTPALVPVENRSLFIYEGTWALLRCMMLHAEKDKDGKSGSSATMLGFSIPLSQVPGGQPSANAKLFVQVVPITTKGLLSENFKVPEFPIFAPTYIMEKKQ